MIEMHIGVVVVLAVATLLSTGTLYVTIKGSPGSSALRAGLQQRSLQNENFQDYLDASTVIDTGYQIKKLAANSPIVQPGTFGKPSSESGTADDRPLPHTLYLITPTKRFSDVESKEHNTRGDRGSIFPTTVSFSLKSMLYLYTDDDIRFRFSNGTLGPSLPVGEIPRTNPAFIRKSRQQRHFQRMAQDQCVRCKSQLKQFSTAFMFVDDDVNLCETGLPDFEWIVNFFIQNQEHIGGIRLGIGSSGMLFSCNSLCQFGDYLAGKHALEQADTDIAESAVDVQMDAFLLSLENAEVGNKQKLRYLTYQYNLFHHDNKAESEMKSQHTRKQHHYGMCNARLFWMGRFHGLDDFSCREFAFSPCGALPNGVTIPVVGGRTPVPGSTPCDQVSAADLNNLQIHVAASDQDCVKACLSLNDKEAKQLGKYQCKANLIGIVNTEAVIKSLAPDVKIGYGRGGGLNSVWRNGIHESAPFVSSSGSSGFIREVGCTILDNVCEARPPQGMRRVCPCVKY